MACDTGGGGVHETGDDQIVVGIEVGEGAFGAGLEHGGELDAIGFEDEGGAPLIAIERVLVLTDEAGADLDEVMGEGAIGDGVESGFDGFGRVLAADDSDVAEVKGETVFTTVRGGCPAGADDFHFIAWVDDGQGAAVGVEVAAAAGSEPTVFEADADGVIAIAQADDLFACDTRDDAPDADAFGSGDLLVGDLLHGGEGEVEGILFARGEDFQLIGSRGDEGVGLRVGIAHVDTGDADARAVEVFGEVLGTIAPDVDDGPGFGAGDHDAEGRGFEGPHDDDAFDSDPFVVVGEGGQFGDGDGGGCGESAGADDRDGLAFDVGVAVVLDVDDFGVAFDFDLVADLGARGIGREGDTDAGLTVVDFERVAI